MKNNLAVKLFVLLSIVILLSNCRSGRPDMSMDMEGKGAVQDIEIFNVTKSGENFKETKNKFKDEVEEVRDLENVVKLETRRVSLSPNKNNNKTSLSIVDHNQFVKKLEDQDISLKFNDMNIKSALKLFASLAQRNIIIGDEVTGTVTVDFENLNWGSAVYAILDINSLVMTVDDNSDLLRVHSKEVYVEMEKAKIERTLEVNKNVMTLEGGGDGILDEEGNQIALSVTEIFKVFNQVSATVIAPLEAALGEDTGIEVIDDPENNQLLVKGSPNELNKVEAILDQIDIEKKQVLIEAYIINASDTFQENFNNNLTAMNASQIKEGRNGISLTGINTSSTNFVAPSATVETGDTTSATLFGDQTIPFAGAALLGNIGITKIKAVINMSIDQNNSETISNPKLFALDGETATLTQGNTQFVKLDAATGQDAALQPLAQALTLTVTPSVIGKSKVQLEVQLDNSSPGVIASGADIATNTEGVTSNILLNSDEVAVLGGVYVNTKTDKESSIPIFSKIPILGTFFKSDTKTDTRNQMLIFISASIV